MSRSCQSRSLLPAERSRDRDRFSHGSDVPYDYVSHGCWLFDCLSISSVFLATIQFRAQLGSTALLQCCFSCACIWVDSKSIASNPCCVCPMMTRCSSRTSPNRTPMMRTDSHLLLLLAATNGSGIWFDHGRRNRICIFFPTLFHRFGLLLLLSFKHVRFKSLSLRRFLPSCNSDHTC